MSGFSSRRVGNSIASLEHGTFSREQLAENMSRLCMDGCPRAGPVHQSCALQIHDVPNEGTGVFLAGPPARSALWPGGEMFKQEAFYSMCLDTPADSVVVMTFSASAQCYMEWWSVFRTDHSYRVLVIVPARLPDLSHEPDSMLAAYLPIGLVQQMKWDHGKLNAAKTISSWLGTFGRLVTIGRYFNVKP